MKGEHLMKTITKSKSTRRSRAFLLSIVCAGAVATLLGSCAEGPYVTAYHTGYYYPTAYYAPDYGILIPTMGRRMRGPRYAPASAITMLTARATTAAQFTAIGTE